MKATTPVDIGLLLRSRRRQLKLDQSELAARVGVSRQWIIDVEKGKARAELGLVLRAAQALGLKVDLSVEAGREPPQQGRAPASPSELNLDAIIDRLSSRAVPGARGRKKKS